MGAPRPGLGQAHVPSTHISLGSTERHDTRDPGKAGDTALAVCPGRRGEWIRKPSQQSPSQ